MCKKFRWKIKKTEIDLTSLKSVSYFLILPPLLVQGCDTHTTFPYLLITNFSSSVLPGPCTSVWLVELCGSKIFNTGNYLTYVL